VTAAEVLEKVDELARLARRVGWESNADGPAAVAFEKARESFEAWLRARLAAPPTLNTRFRP
jgi:hypothetical protein